MILQKNHLNRTACLGEIDQTKLNHLGGSIAFGNPRAVTSLRTVIQSLHALKTPRWGEFLSWPQVVWADKVPQWF